MKLSSAILGVSLTFCLGCNPGGFSQYRGEPLSYWATRATSRESADRSAAAQALGEMGPQGLPALMPLLNDRDVSVRAAATMAIIKMPPSMASHLRKLIHHSDPAVSRGATKALIQILVKMHRKGMESMIELLQDPEPYVRMEAAKAIPRMGAAGKEAIPTLREMLSDDNPGVRSAANMTLRIIGPNRTQSMVPRFQLQND